MDGSALEWVTAISTAGATAAAAWAALSARVTARESRRLIEIEQERDRERVDNERTNQARHVSVVLMTEDLSDDGGTCGVDFHLVLTNSSSSPVFKVRVGVEAGDDVWGPQLFGDLTPGQQAELYGRIYTRGDLDNVDATVRFVDLNGQAWVASARRPASPSDLSPEEWIARGRDFAGRELDGYQRGMWIGIVTPDFDDWRAQAEFRRRS